MSHGAGEAKSGGGGRRSGAPGAKDDPGGGDPSRDPLVHRAARWVLALLVVGLLGVGLALVVAPSAVAATGPGRWLATLVESVPASTALIVRVVGACCAGFALAGLAGAWRSGAVAAFGPGADRRVAGPSVPVGGAEIDEAVERLRAVAGHGETAAADRIGEHLREELRTTAVAALVRANDLTEREATDALAAGTWTDDPRAAAVFGDDDPPWRVWAVDWVGFTPTRVRRATHLVDELDRLLADSDAGPVADDGGDGAGADDDPADPGPPDGAGGKGHPGGSADGVIHPPDGETAVSATGRLAPAADEDTPDDDPADGTRDGSAGGPSAEGTGTLLGDRTVRRRDLGNAAGLVALAVGVVTGTPAAALLGAVAVTYGAFDYVTTTPAPTVEVTRTVGTDRPVPGDVVEVELAVANVGDRVLPDLRVVDGVPDALTVVDGTPALHTALRPGETERYTYAVRARRGTFAFDDAQVVVRNLGGTREVGGLVSVATPIRCSTLLDGFPLDDRTRERVGTVTTDAGGSGVEFYATREYREGDPTSRIDWNRLAKTGELTTVQYREQRGATVALLVDVRDAARVAPGETELDAVDRSVYAAERVLLALLDRGIEVGTMTYDGETLATVRPGGGEAQRARVTTTLRGATDRYATITGTSADGGHRARVDRDAVGEVRRRIPSTAHVVVFSPAVDAFPVDACRELVAAGHPVTLFTPAAVGGDSLGQRARRLERACRLAAVRETGARVIDWATDEAVETAVTRAVGRHLP